MMTVKAARSLPDGGDILDSYGWRMFCRVWQRRMDTLQQDAEARAQQAAAEAGAARDAADAARWEVNQMRQQRLDADSAAAQRLERAREAWEQVHATTAKPSW